jgi:uncharacterized protein (DUF342 family)
MAVRLGLPEVADLMRRYLEEDQGRRSIAVSGKTLEEALKSASVQLEVPLVRVEYEVVEKGVAGLLGAGSKPWKVKARAGAERKKVELASQDVAESEGDSLSMISVARDLDGLCYVRFSPDGVLLKVSQPEGKGKRATERQAIERLEQRGIKDYDDAMVREVVKHASGDYIRVGSYISNPANDALFSVDILEQEMKAFIRISPPGPGGCDLSRDTLISVLRNNRITQGVLEEVLQELEDSPRYREAILVAEGLKPQNGRDAGTIFNFEVDKSKVHLREASDGKVNFRELGLIQNVVQGQPLARRQPPEIGKPGRTVTGKMIPARSGKDMPPPLGRNVHLSDDGTTILADINGQVTYISGKINVEEIFEVQGDVSVKTGDIMFLGNVIILGNVEDGYSVKASGNIEIRGNVGKATIVAEGDIVIHQGINAKSGGSIYAGKNLWAKFIENATVEVGENLIVSEGLINSTVVANKKIICQGRRAAIVGGRYRACEEINAKTLGSPVGGAETLLEVGYDPKSKEKSDQLQAKAAKLKKQLDNYDKNIATLNALKQRKELSEEKEAILQDMILQREDLLAEIKSIAKDIQAINVYLNGLKAKGRISASGRIYPGVKITIKDTKEDIHNETKGLTFYLENLSIRTTRYEEPEDAILKKGPPDAYKTD